MKWKPIETAPKDGTPILACHGNYKANVSMWASHCPITVFWGTYHPNAKGNECWRDGNGHKRPYVTHWMPLPDPPGESHD